MIITQSLTVYLVNRYGITSVHGSRIKRKTLALPVEVVNKTVFDEFKDLPNKVTSAGVTMSEKLSELLAKVCRL